MAFICHKKYLKIWAAMEGEAVIFPLNWFDDLEFKYDIH